MSKLKLTTRIIPTLLLKNNGLYKGVKFQSHKYIGDPINTIKLFNEKECDELVILDITATLENKNPNFELLKDIASEAFMPMAYGGGLNAIEDIRTVFSLGYEKVILNTAAIINPNLIKAAAHEYGSQSIVVSVDAKKTVFNDYMIYIKSGTQKVKNYLLEHIKNIISLGAGEILLSNIDKDGCMSGYDLNLVNLVARHSSVPVIASCGAGKLDDFVQAKKNNASAVAAGSMFVYQGPHRAVLINYPPYELLLEKLGESIEND
ncbi:MAG: AglZ/HisF2 family acetamidino modification protein [Bacteroidales bacterium]|jgi:cyclase|nr:AglZ/HisF2 family acetamidino modification protein [Bacteroidales bacterium]